MISGPIIEPSSGNPPKQMIIFVHGYGADGNDLIGLTNYFQSTLPEAIFLSPHAPEACSMNPTGYQWFDLTSTDPAVLWSKILVAADHLNEFIDSKLLEYNIIIDKFNKCYLADINCKDILFKNSPKDFKEDLYKNVLNLLFYPTIPTEYISITTI